MLIVIRNTRFEYVTVTLNIDGSFLPFEGLSQPPFRLLLTVISISSSCPSDKTFLFLNRYMYICLRICVYINDL